MSELEQRLSRVRALVEKSPPTNEANTLYHVIDPLLAAMGYELGLVHAEQATKATQFIDRTVLPNSPYTWLLEAKSWSVSLNDPAFAIQATNYAHQQMLRWVVLTNGQEWRLYDDELKPQAGQKDPRLVRVAKLADEEEILEFLTALSRDMVEKGRLEELTRRRALRGILDTEFSRASSNVLKAVHKVAKEIPALGGLTLADVSDYFASRFAQLTPKLDPPTPPEPQEESTNGKSVPPHPPSGHGTEPGTIVSLQHLSDQQGAATGRSPVSIQFPGQPEAQCRSWRDLASLTVQWCASAHGSLPLPFAFKGQNGYFLNTAPTNADGSEMLAHRAVETADGTVYCMVHLSARSLLLATRRLVMECGLDPSAVHVVLK